MTNWYDDVDDTTINILKGNFRPLALCTENIRHLFYNIPTEELLQLNKDGEFRVICGDFRISDTLRLWDGWQRPEPEKESHWEECEIITSGWGRDEYANRYLFEFHNHYFNLEEAFAIVGFGGIQFKEWPGDWYVTLQSNIDDSPATPIKVRFWVE